MSAAHDSTRAKAAWTVHEPSLEGLDRLTGVEALCLLIGEDERPLSGVAGFVDWRLCGALSRVLRERFFVGAKGDALLCPTAGKLPPSRIFALGAGPLARLDVAGLAEVLSHAGRVLARARADAVALALPECALGPPEQVEALRRGFPAAASSGRLVLLADRAVEVLLANG